MFTRFPPMPGLSVASRLTHAPETFSISVKLPASPAAEQLK
jgi:hypothetical protein